MTTAAPIRNLMVYFGTRAEKKRQRRLAIVDGNYNAQTLPETAPRFAFIRIAGRICYLRQIAG